MENLEYIDNYFQFEPTPEQTRLFEQRIIEDPVFAQDLAFYLNANEAARESYLQDSGQRFRDIYRQGSSADHGLVRRMQRYYFPAAAAVAVLILGIFLWNAGNTPQVWANKYVEKELQKLDLTMGGQDELQKGAALYNDGKYTEALKTFDNLAKSDTGNLRALEYAGKACIQTRQFDAALNYFTAMESRTAYANPGKFYHALVLMLRGKPGDRQVARGLLQQVVDQDLDKKEIAGEWLSRWK